MPLDSSDVCRRMSERDLGTQILLVVRATGCWYQSVREHLPPRWTFQVVARRGRTPGSTEGSPQRPASSHCCAGSVQGRPSRDDGGGVGTTNGAMK